MTTAKAKLAAAKRRLQRARDETNLFFVLANVLHEAHQQYAVSGNSEARFALFWAGLYVDEISRSRARALRLDDWLGRFKPVRDLPAVLEVGRRLVTEHDEREALKSGRAGV
jgi:hypothetical protein